MTGSLNPHPLTGQLFASPVPPGTGWPEDPAAPDTPVAGDVVGVRELAAGADLPGLEARVSVCRACPRLVAWREDVAAAGRRAYWGQPYWGRPIPGWGDDAPWLLVVGLAPAAHGGNRTGRVFTGDRSGDWIFGALHRSGWAAQLIDGSLRVLVALGAFAWDATLAIARRQGWVVPRPRPRFAHGAQVTIERPGRDAVHLVGCYHVSQQNTFTGRLTEPMLDAVLAQAAGLR